MELKNLRALLIEQLQDVYSAEQQITEALPKMIKHAKSSRLKQAFETHLQQTKGHVQRVEQAFEMLGEKPKSKTCKGMQGLIMEGEELMKEKADSDVLDAGLITAAQRVEHYEIAAYGTLRTFANVIGERQLAQLFQTILDEEGETDKLLTQIAENFVNERAAG